MVGFNPDDNLDLLLQAHPVPKEFDLLSIDIDGNDYHVWEAIQAYRPRLVMIEYNYTIANAVHFVQSKDYAISQGASAAALIELGKSKGYELIAVTPLNLLFITRELFSLFNIKDNSLAAMRDDNEVPHVFVGYDGHVFLRDSGDASLHIRWHSLLLPESAVQLLPERLQKYPEQYTEFERIMYRFWSFFRRPEPARRVMHCRNFVKEAMSRLTSWR